MAIRLALALLFVAASGAAAKSSQTASAQEIEILGTHQSAGERHLVELEVCLMRKFFWKDHEDQGEILWSVLELDIADLAPPDGPDPSIAIVPFPDNATEIVIFTMIPGKLARSEETLLRNPRPPYNQSPRDGGGKYVIREKDGFSFTFKDISSGHMAAFADALFDYRRTFCLPSS